MDLSITPVSGLTLSDPFMIASSHWTSTERAFDQLSAIKPSAVTLKTTSEKKGGDGKESKAKGRYQAKIRTSGGFIAGAYTDGPKEIELWDFVTTYQMTRKAREFLPGTKLGLSILQGEAYDEAVKVLELDSYSYVELNWKYSFRSSDIESNTIRAIEADLDHFIACFSGHPKLVKLPRESIPFIQSKDFSRIVAKLSAAGAGLIVANSKRIRVPPSRVMADDPRELTTGVVVGEYLFLETFDTLRKITQTDAFKTAPIPLIATGGIMDTAGITDVFAAGATAVQLCTVLDVRGVQVVPMLREQLTRLAKPYDSVHNMQQAIAKTEAKWKQAVLDARKIEIQDAAEVERVLGTEKAVRPIFERAIQCELLDTPVKRTPRSGSAIPTSGALVVNYANIAAFLLSVRCLEMHKLRRIDVEGVGEFSDQLKKGLNYDFVILPRSAIISFTQNLPHELSSKVPVEIGEVARSTWQIMGDTTAPKINTLYHFGGNSARHALKEFLKEKKPQPMQITPPMLLPLLKFWHSDRGILAKPPLSDIYGLFADEPVMKNWGQSWLWSEPLCLAASRQHLADNGESGAKEMLACMTEIVEEGRNHPAAVFNLLISTNFISHCTKLVSPKKA